MAGMQRVAVVGPGGAGKTTFATELARRTGLPAIHLDRHYWRPGWVETERDEWRRVQERLLDRDGGWIVDGNYSATIDVRFERADTVIVLAPPRLRCIARALRRTLRNHGRAVQAEGCPERVDVAFLRWIWNYQRRSRPRIDDALRRHRDHLDVFELRSAREARAFLDRVAAGDPPGA
jgi:adenylate kinase family enzyme